MIQSVDTENILRAEIPNIIFDFLDTLRRISELDSVIQVSIAKPHKDIFIVLEEDNVELADKIMQMFAEWECDYKSFPELHIINKNELFYIPNGAIKI